MDVIPYDRREARRTYEVLQSVRRKGASLWLGDGRLRYAAPKGALSSHDLQQLTRSRERITALLDRAAGGQAPSPRMQRRTRAEIVPLAFSQLAHWHLYELGEKRGPGMLSCQIRLRGRLNADRLQQSITEIVRRHDALRTRIVVCNGWPEQVIAPSGDCNMAIHDLTSRSAEHREMEVSRLIESFTNEPFNVTTDPLFWARLIKLSADEHVLILALDHIVSDGFSTNILLRDVLLAYDQAGRGDDRSLPPIPVQFSDYALWQNETQPAWIEEHGSYWSEHLAGCRRVRFPTYGAPAAATKTGWGMVPIVLGQDVTLKLREWCRLRKTTLVMSVFTAYIALVLRWCEVSDAVILYQSDGRVSESVREAIGYFATPLYLRIRLLEGDSFLDLMDRATEEYCRAFEHADFSWMESQEPRPEFTRNGCFNWLPRSRGDEHDRRLGNADDSITWSAMSDEQQVIE